MANFSIQIKRIYEVVSENDGYRILVDRLWPRGISKELVKIDEWKKELAPSTELRKWFNHEVENFEEFKKAYIQELSTNEVELNRIRVLLKSQNVTLLYAAKNKRFNQAVVLAELISKFQT